MVDFTGGTWRSLIDGSEVSAIPDSAENRWPWDEGSDDTVADVIGDNNGTVVGADWIDVADLVGGFGLEFGGEDRVEMSIIDGIGAGLSFSLAITVNLDDISDQVIWSQSKGSNDRLSLQINDSKWHAGVFDGDWSRRESDVDAVTDRVRLGFGHSDNGDIDIAINGEIITDNPTSDTSSGDTEVHYIGQRTDGNVGASMIADNPIVYLDRLDADGWSQDYNSQPWS